MIDVLFEQNVIQNIGLSSEALWHAVFEAHEGTGRTQGVVLPLAFVVLPMVFHQRTAEALASKSQPGALFKAFAEHGDLTIGLQLRMQSMADKTFQALALAFESGLLRLDPDSGLQLIPGRKTAPQTHSTDEVRILFSAARRVGQAFAELNAVQLSIHLNIRF